MNEMFNGTCIRKSGKSYPEIVTKQLEDVKSQQLKVNDNYNCSEQSSRDFFQRDGEILVMVQIFQPQQTCCRQ